MRQLSLIDLWDALESQSAAAQADLLEKQSNISSNITAGIGYFDSVCESADEDCDWGDIYDEYEDFEYCSRVW